MFLRLFQWKRIPFRFSSNRCNGSLRLRTQRAFAFLFFSGSLLLCSSVPAADSETEVMLAVTNLARAVAGSNATQATLDDNVAAILALLQASQLGSNNLTPWKTYPVSTTGYNLSRYLWSGLYDSSGADGVPQSSLSYLREIQRALYGSSGVPNQSEAIQPLLSALSQRDFASNVLTRAEVDFVLSSLLSPSFFSNVLINSDTHAPWLADIGYSTDYGLLDQNSGNPFLLPQYEFFREAMGSSTTSSGDSLLPSEFADFFDLFTQYDRALRADPSGGDALATYSFLHGVSETALSQLDVTFSGALNVQLNQAVEYLISQLASQLDDISGNPHVIGPLNESTNLLAKIHYNDLGYEGSGRSVADDFFFLFQQLGVEHPDPTNNIAAILRRFFAPEEEEELVRLTNSVLDEQLRAKREEVDAAEVVVTNQVSNVATNSPDFEAHQYSESNPIDSGDNIFNLPRTQFNAVTPSLPDSSDRTIVLFQGGFPIFGGNGGTRAASRSVRLDISYPLADHDAVSNGVSMMRSIMEWVWQWVFLILSVRMLFAFYASLTESRTLMNSGVGGLTLN